MAKKKSKKTTSKSKSVKKVVKSVKTKKGKASSSKTRKKPGKPRKTTKKTRKPITWVNKTKQKLQLSRKKDTNRYQTLISIISDYYKKAGFEFVFFLLIIALILLWLFALNKYLNFYL